MKPRTLGAGLALIALSAVSTGRGGVHDSAQCESIDPETSRTGLIFNPRGKQTYYERSRCLLDLAVESRNAEMCARVIERDSWFFDGSTISPEACRSAVQEQISDDQAEADDIQDLHRLISASLGASSNGRDFTLQLVTKGSHPGVYRVDVELLSVAGEESRPVESYRQPLGGRAASLSRHLPREKLSCGNGGLPSVAQLRVTLELAPSSSDPKWVLEHVEQSLSSSRTVLVDFGAMRHASESGSL